LFVPSIADKCALGAVQRDTTKILVARFFWELVLNNSSMHMKKLVSCVAKRKFLTKIRKIYQ
jgi:hypothetical protein